jgi:hypothetical protein
MSRTLSRLFSVAVPRTRGRPPFFAPRFSRKLPTLPRRLMTPSTAATAIVSLSSLGSQ